MSNLAAEKINDDAFEGPFEPAIAVNSNPVTENDAVSAERDKLERALDAGDIEAVKSIIASGIDLNKMNGEDGLTPLEVAIAVKNYSDDILELLLESGANPNLQSDGGLSPLHLVAGYMHSPADGDARTKTAQILVKYGAQTEMRNDQGMTPLAQAVLRGTVQEVVALTMVGADPMTQYSMMLDRSDAAPLLNWAIADPEKVDALLDFGADPLATTDDGRTALELVDEKMEELASTKVGMVQKLLGKGKQREQDLAQLTKSRMLLVDAALF